MVKKYFEVIDGTIQRGPFILPKSGYDKNGRFCGNLSGLSDSFLKDHYNYYLMVEQKNYIDDDINQWNEFVNVDTVRTDDVLREISLQDISIESARGIKQQEIIDDFDFETDEDTIVFNTKTYKATKRTQAFLTSCIAQIGVGKTLNVKFFTYDYSERIAMDNATIQAFADAMFAQIDSAFDKFELRNQQLAVAVTLDDIKII